MWSAFFLVFRQKQSQVLPKLHSTFYLSSRRLCAVFHPKFLKFNIFVKTVRRMSLGTIWRFFWKKTNSVIVFKLVWKLVFRLTRYNTILRQLSTSTEEHLRNSSLSMWPLLVHSFFHNLSCFFVLSSKCSQSCC